MNFYSLKKTIFHFLILSLFMLDFLASEQF